jgi:heat shock protein HslJ
MNRVIFYLVTALFCLILGCEESGDTLNHDAVLTITNTQWTLAKIVSNSTSKVTNFPEEMDSFNIIFKQDGNIELPDYCNFSYGYYELEVSDSIHIVSLGPGTEKYCLPDLYMDWEILFVNSLREANTYSIANNQLTIHCESDYNLVFDFIDNYSYNPGKLLFCTNSYLINCPFQIEISLNQVIIDTLTAASVFSPGKCICEDTAHIGILHNMAPGRYVYAARELNCVATNRQIGWEDYLTVKEDSCTTVFLNVSLALDYQGGR